MIKKVIQDPIFCKIKSEIATKEDLQITQDLLDILIANENSCVGMVSNMIGVCKRIIVFNNEGKHMTMFTLEIVKQSGLYYTNESFLSLMETIENANTVKELKSDGKPLNFKPS